MARDPVDITGAIAEFNKVIALEDNFKEQAHWYLALCYIRQGDNLSARSHLHAIPEYSWTARMKEFEKELK
jgi:hypothetical protein